VIENFEKWKRGLLESYNIFMYGDDSDGAFAKNFCEYIYSIDYCITEKIGDILFSLFTDKDDGEILQSMHPQLFFATDISITTKCLLKAFPKLSEEAKKWAEVFLDDILGDTNIHSEIINSEDVIGKQAIVDFIKRLNEDPPHASYSKNEKLMQAHLEDLARFNELAKDIQNSMKLAT
jgi:hypothetical protein